MRCGARPQAAAAPATVSGERRAIRPLGTSREGGAPATTREPGDLPSQHGNPPSKHAGPGGAPRRIRLGPDGRRSPFGGCFQRPKVARRWRDRPTPMRDVVIHVCVTCRREGDDPDGSRAPARSCGDALEAALPGGMRVLVPVECLGNCKRVLLGRPRAPPAPGPTSSATSTPRISHGDVVAARRPSRRLADGLMPWRGRPEAFKRGMIARIPPSTSRRTPPNERAKDPLHDRHRLPRGRQDDAHPQPPGDRRRSPPRARSSTSSATSASTARSSRAAASRAAPRTTSSSSPMAASAAPSPTTSCRRIETLLSRADPPEHIVIETSGLALPEAPGQGVRLAGRSAPASPSTASSPWSTARPSRRAAFADDPEAPEAAGRGGRALDHDNPLEEVYRGPAPVRRPDRAQQGRPDRRGERQRPSAEATSSGRCRAP